MMGNSALDAGDMQVSALSSAFCSDFGELQNEARKSTQKNVIFRGKNPLKTNFRYAPGTELYFTEVYSTRATRCKKPEVDRMINKGT